VKAEAARALEPFDCELANWQGKIAVAAKNGSELNAFKSALLWTKQDVPPENGLREKAKREIWETAERHLADVHGAGVLDAIYIYAFPEEGTFVDNLDTRTNKNNRSDEIKRLAKLGSIDFALERKTIASKLGIGVGALDEAVKAARREKGGTNGRGRPLELPEIEPWPHPINGAELLDQIVVCLLRYLVLPLGNAEIIAL